ncbi:MAG: hypothetical protein NC222_06950 [Staphylococcus sp.]|nr:hypothetical protein [Staphylococcus sp.]
MKYKIVSIFCNNKQYCFICNNVEEVINLMSNKFGEQSISSVITYDCDYLSKGYLFKYGLGKHIIASSVKEVYDYLTNRKEKFSYCDRVQCVNDITSNNIILSYKTPDNTKNEIE